ncbi:MAG: ACT domain-containing protein [Sporichthyaceae bacterium]|nr:ACT domain-containing protein [Sporichthyaceae bacterium]
MRLVAVTVLGHDRPGIVARTTQLLAATGANLEDSTMTLLRGHFAMVLVAQVPGDANTTAEALRPLTEDGSLVVSVREVPEEPTAGPLGSAYLLAVHGADRPGIVSAVTGVVAAAGGNITDLSTRLRQDLYVLLAEVDLPAGTDVEEVSSALAQAAARLGVDVSLRPVDTDVL